MGKDQDLLEAARNGNVAVIEKILGGRSKRSVPLPAALQTTVASLRRLPNPNCQDSNGYTPLHHAALNGHLETARALLRKDALANSNDGKGCCPLHLAAWNGYDNMCEVLLTHGPTLAKVNQQSHLGETPLHSAAQYGHTNTVEVLLEYGGNPLLRNHRNESPLDLASQYGRLDTVAVLLGKRPDLVVEEGEVSPLHLAARSGHLHVAQLLLDYNYDVNTKTESGSALHEAALFGKQDVVLLLLRHGVDVNLTDCENRTSLEVLSEHKSPISIDTGRIILDYIHTGVVPDKRSSTHSQDSVGSASSLGGTPCTTRLITPRPASAYASLEPSSSPVSLKSESVSFVSSVSSYLQSAEVHGSHDSLSSHGSSIFDTQSLPNHLEDNDSSFGDPHVHSSIGCHSPGLCSASSHTGSPSPHAHTPPRPIVIATQSGRSPRLSPHTYSPETPKKPPRRKASSKTPPFTKSYSTSSKIHPRSLTVGGGSLSVTSGPVGSHSASSPLLIHSNYLRHPPAPGQNPKSPGSAAEFIPGTASLLSPREEFREFGETGGKCSTVEDDECAKYFVDNDSGDGGTLKKVTRSKSVKSDQTRRKSHPYVSSSAACGGSGGTCSAAEKMSSNVQVINPNNAMTTSMTLESSNSHFHNENVDIGEVNGNHILEDTTLKRTGRQSRASPPPISNSRESCSLDNNNINDKMAPLSVVDNAEYLKRSSETVTALLAADNNTKDLHGNDKAGNDGSVGGGGGVGGGGSTLRPDGSRLSHTSSASSSTSTLTDQRPTPTTAAPPPPPTPPSAGPSTPASRPPSLELGGSAGPSSKRSSQEIPLTPTGYDQPPTPDHPPPSPMTALLGIQEKINPLEKRRSRDIETFTEAEFLAAVGDNISLSTISSCASRDSADDDSRYSSDSPGGSSSMRHSPDGVVVARRRHKPSARERAGEEFFSNGNNPFLGLTKGSIPAGERRTRSQVIDSNIFAHPSASAASSSSASSRARKRVSAPGLYALFRPLMEEGAVKVRDKTGQGHEPGGHHRRRSYRASLHKESAIDDSSSPIDENEEWAKIAAVLSSCGGRMSAAEYSDYGDFEKRLQTIFAKEKGSGRCVLSVGAWLEGLGLAQYENTLISNGFDHLDFMGPNVLDDDDLLELGVMHAEHRQRILEAACSLPSLRPIVEGVTPGSVEEWLQSLRLEEYYETFQLQNFSTMDRVRNIWELELNSVLDITMLGHRKRILASLRVPADTDTISQSDEFMDFTNNADWKYCDKNEELANLNLYKDYTTLTRPHGRHGSTHSKGRRHSDSRNSDSCHSDCRHSDCRQSDTDYLSETGDSANSHGDQTSPLPHNGLQNEEEEEEVSLRPPNIPDTEVRQWRHRPEVLIKGCCNYTVQYLGSSLVKDLQGTESTREAIHKMKKCADQLSKVPNIVLSISYRGVKFIDAKSKLVVCEHEISNIFCACQDGENLNYFAYITRDMQSEKHYCHVFSVRGTELATEIILTLGEAFEVAYQVAVRERTLPNPDVCDYDNVTSPIPEGSTDPQSCDLCPPGHVTTT